MEFNQPQMNRMDADKRDEEEMSFSSKNSSLLFLLPSASILFICGSILNGRSPRSNQCEDAAISRCAC